MNEEKTKDYTLLPKEDHKNDLIIAKSKWKAGLTVPKRKYKYKTIIKIW